MRQQGKPQTTFAEILLVLVGISVTRATVIHHTTGADGPGFGAWQRTPATKGGTSNAIQRRLHLWFNSELPRGKSIDCGLQGDLSLVRSIRIPAK